MIILEDVEYSYDGIYTALRGVTLQVDRGESVAIMGTNGAGKTTLIKHFNGLLRPQAGNVFLEGKDTSQMSVAEMAKIVGLVFQNPDHQLFLESCKKEIAFGLKNLGFTQEEAEERCDQTLSRLGLEGFAERSPFALSGGERKRVALASVLATEPDVLALDEPTIGQDARQKESLARMLMEMNKKGRTVIVVTHDIEFVIEHFPRTIAMSDGQIVADGDTSSVLTHEEVLERCSLTLPQMTQAAKALRHRFDNVSDRLASLSDIESIATTLLEGA
ncbi:MAG: ABC transporter ATP-binding protein [Candidatus Thorarchaeota archaeon]|nr:MAG: ABC transporter ATP-binding protein [Candidatus Thorarchaeota archaeon]